MDCFNEPRCLAGARFYKGNGRVEKLGTHSDEKPNENVMLRIHFEALLKKQARSAQHANRSVLNLYKAALAVNYKGILLPSDHKTSFLAKLRRIRKYELEKQRNPKPQQNRTLTVGVDASTSPFTPNTLARGAIAGPSTNSLRRLPRNLHVVPPGLPRISPRTPVPSLRVLRSANRSISNDIQTPAVSSALPRIVPYSLSSPRVLSSVSRAVSNDIQTPVVSSVSTRVASRPVPPSRVLRSMSRAVHVASSEVGMANVSIFVIPSQMHFFLE